MSNCSLSWTRLAISSPFVHSDSASEICENLNRKLELDTDHVVSTIRFFERCCRPTVSHSEAIDKVSEALSSVADPAVPRGVTICRETHDARCHPEHIVKAREADNRDSTRVGKDVLRPCSGKT